MMETIRFKIKDSIIKKKYTYMLLLMYESELLPENSVPNIIAVDKNGNLLWVIEPPTTKFDIYSKIYFKENVFFAVTSAGQVHQIDERTGKIISSKMVK